jgi:leader peptidase (prepilin peptidase)/N-methyltransferase
MLVPAVYWPAYGLFFSALIIATITDLDSLVISRFTSLFLTPIGWLCAFYGVIPVSIVASITGSIFGYGLLYITAYIFSRIMKKQGLGQGDMDLLACIGAFTGIIGAWFSLLIGSLAGSVIGLTLIATKKVDRSTLIPFGPFLAVGALMYILYIFSGIHFAWLSQIIL